MNYQISMQLYENGDSVKTNPAKEYIYSKVYSESTVKDDLLRILGDLERGDMFIRYDKKDGELWVRATEIRTLFIKPADPAYGH